MRPSVPAPITNENAAGGELTRLKPLATGDCCPGLRSGLMIGACGTVGSVSLHVWLPDAMAGPTPVSALIHAATMVTAGLYM